MIIAWPHTPYFLCSHCPSICRFMHIHTFSYFCLTSIACSNIPLLSFENEVIFTLTTHSCYTYMYINCFSSHLKVKLAESLKLAESMKLAEGLKLAEHLKLAEGLYITVEENQRNKNKLQINHEAIAWIQSFISNWWITESSSKSRLPQDLSILLVLLPCNTLSLPIDISKRWHQGIH